MTKFVKGFVASALAVSMVAGAMAGCSAKTNDEVETTTEMVETTEEATENAGDLSPAQYVWTQFQSEIKENRNLEEVANAILADEAVVPFGPMVMPVEEGLLNGFGNTEIKGFTQAVTFGPMIGTIPFIGYIFETDDVDTLKATLESSADLRWNICTEADEMLVESVDNYVFFVMATNTWE